MAPDYTIVVTAQREAAGPADPIRPVGFWRTFWLTHRSPRFV
jgi:hypothetical protein